MQAAPAPQDEANAKMSAENDLAELNSGGAGASGKA
jgi:hypothetical protein